MKRCFARVVSGLLTLVMALLLCSCQTPRHNTIAQYSTIDALVAGLYDGQMPCEKLKSYGNLGIGTFDRLEGEMVLLDGQIYQVKADGHVYRPQKDMTTPFASVTRFTPDRHLDLKPGTDFTQLQNTIDKLVGNTNLPYAIKIKGTFQTVKTRSVPAQNKPYPPLVKVTENQPTFEMEHISGTLIGFRLPAYVKGINVPGYHIHFLSDDTQKGGHLLNFTLESGTAEIAVCQQILLILPEGSEDFSRIDLSKDRTHEVKQAEEER